MKVVDNFLPEKELQKIKSLVMSSGSTIHFNIQNSVASQLEGEDGRHWNWYGQHMVFNDSMPIQQSYNEFYWIFKDKLEDFHCFQRIKINFYPYTESVMEHGKHRDASYSHRAAVFSINTCDGFTRMEDGSRIDSVENRIVYFDGSSEHNSSTTSNCYGRYNINFNYF